MEGKVQPRSSQGHCPLLSPRRTLFLMLLGISHGGRLQIFGTLCPTSKSLDGGERKQEGLCKQNGCICLSQTLRREGSTQDVLIYPLNREIEHLQWDQLVFADPPGSSNSAAALFGPLRLLNMPDNIKSRF